MKEYDIYVNTNGSIAMMNRGFFEKVNNIALCDWNENDYFTFENYRILKGDITYNDFHRRAFEKFFKRRNTNLDDVLRKESES